MRTANDPAPKWNKKPLAAFQNGNWRQKDGIASWKFSTRAKLDLSRVKGCNSSYQPLRFLRQKNADEHSGSLRPRQTARLFAPKWPGDGRGSRLYAETVGQSGIFNGTSLLRRCYDYVWQGN